MRSIQSKTTLLTIAGILVAIIVATIISAISVRNIGIDSAKQNLQLLCEAGEKSLDYYFESVEQSVETVSTYIKSDLLTVSDTQLNEHMDRARNVFNTAAKQTNGVMTYYYRIDPNYSETEKGFWYVKNKTNEFVEHAVTDISKYDTQDTSKLVWFTVPKFTGKAIWLKPYITETIEERVISYNVPIYQGDNFVGVVGIEISYITMKTQVDSIKLHNTGYAFIDDGEGHIVYHPYIDVLNMDEKDIPTLPKGLISDKNAVSYRYDGVDKIGVWRPLSNGTRLNVVISLEEVNGPWQRLIIQLVIAAIVVATVFATLTIIFARHIAKPLRELTNAAEQINEGNYNVKLDYKGNDEIGTLTTTVNRLIEHLDGYISDLNSLAYADALTSVRNKGAYDLFMEQIQKRINEGEDPKFAIAIFDCDDLKHINDTYGHEKGDVYLKNSCHLICRVFSKSPVFRLGGDEFAAILQGEDYLNREKLKKYFIEKSAEICAFAKEPWEKISVAIGLADYSYAEDKDVHSVARRADHLMYEDKHARKQNDN